MSKRIITLADEDRRMAECPADVPDVLSKLKKFALQANGSEALILFTNTTRVHEVFRDYSLEGELFREQIYEGGIIADFIPSEILTHPALNEIWLVLGRIEFVAIGGKVQLIVIVEGRGIHGCKGILFLSESADKAYKNEPEILGQISRESDLYHWVVSPKRDILRAIFEDFRKKDKRWGNNFSLVLYIPK